MQGLIGKKIGMTSVFDKDGFQVNVSVIQLGPCPVVQVKTMKKEKYGAVQLGFGDVKATKLKLASAGHFKKANLPAYKHLQEFRVDNADEFAAGPDDRREHIQRRRVGRRDRENERARFHGTRQAPQVPRRRLRPTAPSLTPWPARSEAPPTLRA